MQSSSIFRLDLSQTKAQDVWITSDSHYGHRNICRGTSRWKSQKKTRDFDTIDEMNDQLVRQINHHVNKDDILIHLGDFAWPDQVEEFRGRIKCKNVHLIIGNHDLEIQKSEELRSIFSSVSQYGEIRIFPKGGGYFTRVCLMHYPIKSWNGKYHGSFHLHGHVHSNHKDKYSKERTLDVGVDGSPGLAPYRLTDALALIEKNEIKPVEAEDIFSILIGMAFVGAYIAFFNYLIGGGMVEYLGGPWGVVLTITGMGTIVGELVKDWFLD